MLIYEPDLIARSKNNSAALHFPHPELWPLEIAKYAQVQVPLMVDPGNVLDDLSVFLVGAVGEVQPKYGNSFLGQVQELFVTAAGRSDGRDDFCVVVYHENRKDNSEGINLTNNDTMPRFRQKKEK